MDETQVERRIGAGTKMLMLGLAVLFDLLPLLTVLGVGALAFSGASQTIVGAIAAGGAMFLVGPTLYIGASWIISLITILVYTLWFALCGVNMWAFRGNRMINNMIAALIENIPLLDLLPGTTFMVWRHIAITDTEDRAHAAALAQQRMQGGMAPQGGRRYRAAALRRSVALAAVQEARTQRSMGNERKATSWSSVYRTARPARRNRRTADVLPPDASTHARVRPNTSDIRSPKQNNTRRHADGTHHPRVAADSKPIVHVAAA